MSFRAYKFTDKRKQIYLNALAAGYRRGAAAVKAGVTRQTASYHIRHDPDFASACEAAELLACDAVEDALYQKALDGHVCACLVWLYNRSQGRWRDMRFTREPMKPEEMNAEQIKDLLRQRGLNPD